MATFFTNEKNEQEAWRLARCETARRLLSGNQKWSLADLKGRAKEYGGSYARARDRLLRDLRDAGMEPVTLYCRCRHGERVVVI